MILANCKSSLLFLSDRVARYNATLRQNTHLAIICPNSACCGLRGQRHDFHVVQVSTARLRSNFLSPPQPQTLVLGITTRTSCSDYSRRSQKPQPRPATAPFRRPSRIRRAPVVTQLPSLPRFRRPRCRMHRHRVPDTRARLFGMSSARATSSRSDSIRIRRFTHTPFAHSRRLSAWIALMASLLRTLRSLFCTRFLVFRASDWRHSSQLPTFR